MAMFTYSKYVIAVPWISYNEPLIIGRPGRKALIFTSANNGGNWRFDPAPLPASRLSDAMFYMNNLTVTLTLLYSELGPLVESSWFGNDGGAGPLLVVTEVYQLK